MHLSTFKERGVVAFKKILSIPSSERIPSLAKNEQTRYELLIAITASLKSAFSNMNLKMGMNEDQVIELAECIIDQSEEDNLALEDVLIFLQKMLLGDTISDDKKEGRIFDRMDIPKFFEIFETYRQSRHEEILAIRDEENIQFKVMGRDDRRPTSMASDETKDPQTLIELMGTIYGKDE